MCADDPGKAEEAIDVFAAYLRGNLESLTEEDLIPFARELEYTQAYLELETLSGSRHFVVEYDLGVTDFMLPPLVLQPVVENAVKHGASAGESATLITIATRENDGCIYIEVTNRNEGSEVSSADDDKYNGLAMEAPTTAKNSYKKKSVGLENVRTRLTLQCDGTLDLNRFLVGAKATIVLPKVEIHVSSQKK